MDLSYIRGSSFEIKKKLDLKQRYRTQRRKAEDPRWMKLTFMDLLYICGLSFEKKKNKPEAEIRDPETESREPKMERAHFYGSLINMCALSLGLKNMIQ